MGEPRLTASEWAAMLRSPTKDTSYRQTTRLGPYVVDFLAWLELARRRPRTLDQYERDIRVGCLLYPEKPIEEWTSAEMLHVLQTFPPGSQRRSAAAWRRFWRWAVMWDHVDRNPMDRLPEIKAPPRKVIDIFTDEEEARLIAQPELRDRALVLTLLDSGIRRDEARHLRGKHVDLDARVLFIIEGKGGKDRIVPIAGRLEQALADLLLTEGVDQDDHLWYTVKSNQYGSRVMRRKLIGEASFYRWWADCLERARVRYRKPHTTRHTFATRWLRDGGSLVTLSKMLGHSSIKVTVDEYAHLVTEDIAAELARLVELRAESSR